MCVCVVSVPMCACEWHLQCQAEWACLYLQPALFLSVPPAYPPDPTEHAQLGTSHGNCPRGGSHSRQVGGGWSEEGGTCLLFQAVGSFHRPLKLLNLTLLNQHAIVDACRAGPLEESYPESEALLSWALVSLVIALFLQLMFAESHKFDWWVLCNQRPCFVYLTCCQVILSGEEDHVLPLLNLPSIIMSFLHCTLSTYCTQ